MHLDSIGSMGMNEVDAILRQIAVHVARGIQADLTRPVTVSQKNAYDGTPDGDIFTNIDTNAQVTMLEMVSRLLPAGIGLICEEDEFRRPCTFTEYEVVLTGDPLDGTKITAQLLEQGLMPSAGQVSTMLGLQVNGESAASYVCDVSNLALYTRQPYGTTIWQIMPGQAPLDTATLPRADSLMTGTLLRHGEHPVTSLALNQLLKMGDGDVQQARESIGLAVVRILSGEFVGMIRPSNGYLTPWDDTPIQAFCEQGDVLMLEATAGGLRQVRSSRLTEKIRRDNDLLYVSRHYLAELREMMPVTTLDE